VLTTTSSVLLKYWLPKKEMKTFHYTSLENWWHIQDDGAMIPYAITKPELISVFPGLTAVWLWQRDLHNEEHVGSVLWQVMTKNTTKVVKLEVDVVSEHSLFRRENSTVITILHEGRLGDWVYHTSVPAVLSPVSIPLDRIRLVGNYDILGIGA
jgi:hypothetical protein